LEDKVFETLLGREMEELRRIGSAEELEGVSMYGGVLFYSLLPIL